eukprot:4005609-Prymnesium_polylepis.1
MQAPAAATSACPPPLGAGVGIPTFPEKYFQKLAMAESKKKFLKIYVLWTIRDPSLSPRTCSCRCLLTLAALRRRPRSHLRRRVQQAASPIGSRASQVTHRS